MLLGLGLWVLPGLHAWFNAFSLDSLFLTRTPTPATDVLIVALDEDSHHRLGQLPDRLWDRALHAKLVETLVNKGARAIVFDIVFAEEWENFKVDVVFAEVLR